MAIKTPLVVGNDGLMQQLQPGDTMGSAAVTTVNVRGVSNADAAAAPFGTPMYSFGAGTVKRGQANAYATSKVLGLMNDAATAAAAIGNIATDGIMVGATAQWDAVAGTTGGLAFGVYYFLDPATIGKITSTVPTTAGQSLVRLGKAFSTTELDLDIQAPTLL